MKAAWYKKQGPATVVLHVGELPTPSPKPGEVRVKIHFSGVNAGDIKKRAGWLGFGMPYPLIIPHSDGAGVIDAMGDKVDKERIGQRVWVYGAQSYRQYGTAAEYCVVPASQAVALPDEVSDEIGACLGIPGITAHRAVFADGLVKGKMILVHGMLGAVSSLAAQLAHHGGAKIIGTVRHQADIARVDASFVHYVLALDQPDLAERIRKIAPAGVDRIIEVSLSDNIGLDSEVIANNGTIAAYASRSERPELPFWPMLFSNVTLRMLGSDDFPLQAKQQAAIDLTAAAKEGKLHIPIAKPFSLDDIAEAHNLVEAGSKQRVLIKLN